MHLSTWKKYFFIKSYEKKDKVKFEKADKWVAAKCNFMNAHD